MLQEYTILDLFPELPKRTSYYFYFFEKLDLSHLVWPHKCDFYSLVWFTEGGGVNVIDSTEYLIIPNRIFLISPRQIQNNAYLSDAGGYILLFDKIVAAQIGINFNLPYVDISPEHVLLLKLAVENTIRKKPGSNIEIDLLYIYSLIVDEIDDESLVPARMNILFGDFKELVLTHDVKIQSMDQYADTLHISLTTLNDLCRFFVGSSAKQFLLDFKIAEAKRLLINSQLNISDIAYRLGFEDASYFARIFKKKTSLSPSVFLGKYRK